MIGMTTVPEHSGADLARIALANARKAAKGRPATDRAVRRRTARRRGDGRDPLQLGAAIGQLMDDRAWEAPTAGADLVADWPAIAPELAGKVAAERFDPETGVLHLRPASPTYAANLRLLERQMVRRINDKTGRPIVRALRVLAPGHVDTPPATTPAPRHAPDPAPAEPAAPLPPHPAYRAALEAIHAAQHTTTTRDRADQALRDRYFAGHRDVLREPAPAFTDAVTALEETTADTTAPDPDPDTVRRAAITRARHEKTGRAPAVHRAFGGAA